MKEYNDIMCWEAGEGENYNPMDNFSPTKEEIKKAGFDFHEFLSELASQWFSDEQIQNFDDDDWDALRDRLWI